MGHLRLRKILKKETIWIEKGINKHKHHFNLPYILEEKSPNGNLEYHNILKCDICNSFKSIPETWQYWRRNFRESHRRTKEVAYYKRNKKA